MNERIKQLAIEAGLRFTQLMSNPMVPVVDGKETDLEKFAELIVRECLKIVEPDRTSGDEWCLNLDETAQSIRQHFGVAE